MGKLLDWFGPSRSEIWRKLSAQLEGRYTASSWLKGDRIDVEHGPWTITLDTFIVMVNNVAVPFTRFRAPFLNKERFRMKIYRSSIFSSIGKWFGMQDVEVGSLQFDDDFIVKASDEQLVRRFGRKAELRRALMAQESIQLAVLDDAGWFGGKFPADTDLLNVVVSGHLKDTERIRELFDLFALALDQLCEIGVAYEDGPGHEL